MSGGEILFLAHRLPFPPDRGDRIRSAHVLKALARIAPVHVGCFVDEEADRAHERELELLSASTCVVHRAKPLALAGLEALWRGEPVSLSAFRSRKLADWVQALLESRRIAAIYIFSGQMGQFVPPEWQGQLVVDLCDVDSAKFDAYGKQSLFPHKLLYRREAAMLAQVEAQLAARADHTLLISDAEAELLRGRTSGARSIATMGNGIDAVHFAPQGVMPDPAMLQAGTNLLFTGQMDYPPNVAAVERMTLRIMPQVLRALPQARFHVVGRAPTAAVLALDGINGTLVHGEVPDMRPFLAGADLVTVPLDLARGVQNKVLEAMAMARPVILSPQAATGIDARSGEHFQIAGDDAAFIAQIVRLAADPAAADALGSGARRFVVEQQSWPAMLAALPAFMGMSPDAGKRRDAA